MSPEHWRTESCQKADVFGPVDVAVCMRLAALWRGGSEWIREVPREVLVRHLQPREGGHEKGILSRDRAEIPSVEQLQA